MTNQEALLAQAAFLSIGVRIVHSIWIQLAVGQMKSNSTLRYRRKALDMALAGLYLFIASQATSIKELDWGITNVSVKDLLALRKGLLNKWDEEDPFANGPTIKAVSLW